MKFAIVAEIAVLALAGVIAFSAVAQAQPSNRECWAMADKVKAAMASHPASDEATAHYTKGTEACTKGFTALGVSQFQAALKALGG